MNFDLNKRHCFYFNELCKIPHGSYNEKAISEYIVNFAKEHNLRYKCDDMYNVIVYKDASEGYENADALIIQAHMDMVCEANKDTIHDFINDPIKTYVKDGWLYASGTTLGADDGVGVAYMLAILEDNNLSHGALECVFTVQEEVGLFGAMNLKAEDLKAKRMISLDGGGETSTLLSSAGGCIIESCFKAKMEMNDKPCYKLMVKGLSGGHSGGEIHKEKGNANKLALRIIKEMGLSGIDLRLINIDGGLKDNAIPRESEVEFASNDDYDELLKALNKPFNDIKSELEFSDEGFKVELNKISNVDEVMDKDSSKKLIDYIYLLPNGFRHRSMAIEGLTNTSLNLGIIRTVGNEVRITSSIRSALESGISHLVETIETLASYFDIETKTSAYYPSWNYEKESKMREYYKDAVKELYDGQELEMKAAHGGCECGVFKALISDIDIISLGPVSKDIHTPDECLDLASFDRAYKLLCNVISRVK